MDTLQKELETYENHKKELLSMARGKFVLIKSDKILGEFDTEADAIQEGYLKFGNTAFLVKQILEIEQTLNFVTHNLSI